MVQSVRLGSATAARGSRLARQLIAAAVVALGLLVAGGCTRGPVLVPKAQQQPIDRSLVEYPAGFELRPLVRNLSAPTAVAFDNEGSVLIAQGGFDGEDPRIFGYRPDGTRFDIYPTGGRIPFDLVKTGFRIYGPIGGMLVHNGRVYVTHRDENRRGVITAFGYDGSHSSVVADLPAQGDYGVTDMAISPVNGRLYFGVGAATNSGVVGLDNWSVNWVRHHPAVADVSYATIKLLGYHFSTPNPRAGLFGGSDIAVTAPFQPFGNFTRTRISGSPKPGAAIYSVGPTGGDLRVEAHGIRYPRGLAFNEFGRLYITNNGMELRGTRPVKDDPDALLRLVPGGTWYGWPDYSTDLYPVSEARFQPPVELIIKTGYPDLSAVVDHQTSGLTAPDRGTLLQATFPSLSGAARMDVVPGSGPFRDYRGNIIVALNGDRAPFSTSGYKLASPVGYKVVRVDPDTRQVKDFVHNTRNRPASHLEGTPDALERPIDVKFGPDGAMYILDFGRMTLKNGRERIASGTGKLYRLSGIPTTQPQPEQP